jgi:hypothetical protein
MIIMKLIVIGVNTAVEWYAAIMLKYCYLPLRKHYRMEFCNTCLIDRSLIIFYSHPLMHQFYFFHHYLSVLSIKWAITQSAWPCI